MKCNEVLSLIDQLIDGETAPADEVAIRQHLQDCADCAVEFERRAQLSGQLRMELSISSEVDGRIRSSVMEVLNYEAPGEVAPVQKVGVVGGTRESGFQTHSGIMKLILAVAAGFLLAVFIFQPWNRVEEPVADAGDIPTVPVIQTFGTLAVATGDIEVQCKDEDWTGWTVQTAVPVEASLRTGATTGCEIVQDDGVLIRIGEDSEVTFSGDKAIELNEGRMFVCRGDNEQTQPMAFSCGSAAIEVDGNVDIRRLDDFVEVMPVDSEATIGAEEQTETIPAGHVARVSTADGQIRISRLDESPVLATSWMNPILQRNDDDEELDRRVGQLLAQIGQTKLDHLYEDEIRSLGVSAVEPLLAFLRSEQPEHQDPQQRMKAAQIISDLATRQHAMNLVDLLDHVDAAIGRVIESGLQRITGQSDQIERKVRSPQNWRSIIDDPVGCNPGSGRWMATAGM